MSSVAFVSWPWARQLAPHGHSAPWQTTLPPVYTKPHALNSNAGLLDAISSDREHEYDRMYRALPCRFVKRTAVFVNPSYAADVLNACSSILGHCGACMTHQGISSRKFMNKNG
mmetsp:Transcript_11649/g.36116  ORF Transcript_11649/g.36116 Transcript_11649/m.36116 type:complete len:114 (+) Transcript_11649:241-582(+)